MKSKHRIPGLLAVAALLLGSGFVLGWHLQERHSAFPPVITELTLDAKNRPVTLKTFITLPDCKRLKHGRQFIWEWQDHPTGFSAGGLSVSCEDYDAGEMRRFSAWINPGPGKAISPDTLTKYPDER